MHFFFVISSIITSSIWGFAESEPGVPAFAFSWLDDRDTYHAGDIATIKIKILGNFNNNTSSHTLNLTLTVNEMIGNSSYISGVSSVPDGDPANWNITFIPILAGVFNLLITDDRYKIFDSSLHFNVLPGSIHPSACVASWRGLVNEFVAGERAAVLILPKDAFGNNISSTSEEPKIFKFEVSASSDNGSVVGVLNLTDLGWTGYGYVCIEFIASTAGNLLLHIKGENQTLNGSPLPFKVNPGPLDITKCLAKWNYETNALQIFSKLEIFIQQQDQFGNLVPGLYEFDARVVEKETNLSIPIPDLLFKEVAPGIQLFSFGVFEPGDFWLTILDIGRNQSISNMPYQFSVFVGYCDGLNSVINGSGLLGSTAGEISKFSVYLEDTYHNPSPVEVGRLRVQITREVDSYNVWPNIFPMQIVDGPDPTGARTYGAHIPPGLAPASSVDSNNTPGANLKGQASAYDVIYTAEKSGTYEIRVFCGNILLNGGIPYIMEVRPGEVDTKLSGVISFGAKVSKIVENEIVLQLVDSFSNPVLFKQTKLTLGFRSDIHGFLIWTFVEDKDGLYICHYAATEIGAYELCVSFEEQHLSPCTFWVYVYNSEYFPKAYNDNISVWEDESISFDVLGNDYFAGNGSIVEISKPSHGSLLQYGRLFRYTPYKGFFGNDTFSYTILDINNNTASGTVFISVLITPPQFLSLPVLLQATEDVISPRFGGFPGIDIIYSDPKENFSVILSAKYGTIFLAPMLMQFWQPTWSGLSVDRVEKEGKSLILVGCVEVIDSVLQSVQYLGNDNFSGDDIITVSTINKNGLHDTHIPVFVQPINDPPFIDVPEFIMLERDGENGSRIFERERDRFEFFIGDPDIFGFPGNESNFMITLSLEVNDGILMTKLPGDLVNTTELKLRDSYQWQPLQTFVTISKHFSIKAKGVRFYGTIKDCNEAMQELVYQGGEHGAVLTITVNDMGNYGCYADCSFNMSLPLFTEATVNLIRRQPMNSLVSHTLGSAVVIEFVVIVFLGALLLFFICKCAFVLGCERRKRRAQDSKPCRTENSHKKSSSAELAEDRTDFTGCCPRPSVLRSQPSNFRQRSRHQYGECSKDASHSSQSSSDQYQNAGRTSFTPLSIEMGKRGSV